MCFCTIKSSIVTDFSNNKRGKEGDEKPYVGMTGVDARVCAIVTGASSGMGVHYAGQLYAMGYNVLLVSNQEKEIKEVADRIANSSSTANENNDAHWARGLYKDLSSPDSAMELFNYCNTMGYEVEVLVNNAGIFFFKELVDCTIQRIETIISLHVGTVTLLCRLFGEQMCNRRRGYILNMSSISTATPFSGISLYTATKSYIKNFSLALRLEMMESGVRVLTVSPGAVATDLYNLPKNLQQLGVKLGVIYRPEKLVSKALKKLFNGRRGVFVPGCLNYLFKPIYAMLPLSFKMYARRRIKIIINS